ncbi:MAG: AAA family ATPase [Anaeroplasma sp.]|uniref:ATP-binding protein n=1 Tax=Anaeroplasma sp. TaxID=1872523 RepID=UPI002A9190AD|nr:AAA family ATPase [Anaeroplasma sp.]MDY5983652.1 AAA family ATPase [Anaeroplasma sp.]
MKLISLYIDNFGKLSDYSFDFSKTLNSLYEENGWGKTTLTVFIKSMLYGLNKTERTLYSPWKNVSSFGGYLILEASGRNYRIERQFSTSKSTLDTIRVYDLQSGFPIDKFGSNIGEAILNLNEASFERSVFIPQKDLNEGFNSDIEAKLANLIGGTDDSQSFEEAIEILSKKAKELKLNSKKGLIVDKKMELAQIEDEIEEVNKRMEGLPILQNQISQINEEIHILNDEKKNINNRILNFTKSQDKRAKLEVVAKYEEDIKYTKKLLEENNFVFNGHDVTQEEVLEYRSKNKELQSLRTQYEVKKSNNRASMKIEKLEKDLNLTEIPDEETLDHITDQIMKYNNIKSVIQAHDTSVKERKKPKLGIALTVVSSVLIIVGVALFIVGFFMGKESQQGFSIAGIAISILAILGYIGALAAFLVNNSQNNALAVGGQVKSYDYEKIHLEEELREFFARYHLYSSNFTNNMFIVRANIQRYKDAQDDFNDISRENKDLENKIKELENAIQHFLGQFNSSATALTTEEKIGELNTHLRKKKEIEDQLSEKESLLKTFISMNQLDVIDDANFSIEEENQKIADIDLKIDELNSEKTTLLNKCAEYENEIAMLDEYNSERENVEIDIRIMEEEYRLLNLSMDYLTHSQNCLLEKYVKPMKDSVNKYISLLLKDTEDYSIDVNFNFQFMTEGGLKGIDSYSRGYQNIISLCMRLALIDCLYPQEKPFIILDDPFVNFDDEKLELCKALIRTISKQYQIVYFACHKSREIHVKAEDKKTIPDAVTRPIFQKPTPIRASVKEMLGEGVLKDEPKKPINAERPKRLSIEDELLEDLTRVKPQDVRPAQVRKIDATTIKKDVQQATPKTQKTIVIKRQEPESDEPKVKPRTIKINK